MATEASPSSDCVPRKPLPIPRSPPQYYADGEEFKENHEGKPLTKIPLSQSGMLHVAPLSPVKVNFQPEDWPPPASTAKIEEGPYLRQMSGESAVSEPDQYESSESRIPKAKVIPHRSKDMKSDAGEAEQPRAAIMSPMGTRDSRSPSSASWTSLGEPRVPLPEHADEYQDGFTNEPVPQLQYYHQQSNPSEGDIRSRGAGHSKPPQIDPAEAGAAIDRYLTPTSQISRRTPIQRPMSSYSDVRTRSRSPAGNTQSPILSGRAASAQSGLSHDNRPMSYIDLVNVPYPQPPPVPISFDNSPLRNIVGSNASLLSTQKTLEMYRQNVKKTNDAGTQYAFAIFLIAAAQGAGLGQEEDETPRKGSPKSGRDANNPYIESVPTSPRRLLREARQILHRLSDRGHPFAQYYLADGYASGLFNKGKEDYGTAFPLFVAASKHGHAESGYRAALCYEFGWGCRKDPAKAVQFYRQSASKNHPGAMTRLGRACLSGDLGLNKYREGLTWLKRATESADQQYNAAPYHLGLLYETGYGDDIFLDETYAAQLFTQAADLGHAEASYRLGDAYEHGKLSCPRDPALSVHFYTCAAQRGHPAAMMALCAWYMVGAEPVLEQDENEAYEWARQAAECGLTKAEYAVGYFTEMGIGCRRDPLEANVWYVKAADSGDERAKQRLAAIRAAASGGTPMEVAEPKTGAKVKKSSNKTAGGENEKDCIIM